MYYVYLISPYGTELIGSGTKEECEKVKANKDKEWKPGYYWYTELSQEKKKENSYYD